LKKKIWANLKRIIEPFTQNIVIKLSKICVWDQGSGKNLFRIPDPGVKKAPDPGSAILLKTKKEVMNRLLNCKHNDTVYVKNQKMQVELNE
jgi:hypothetical protein